MKWRQSVGRTRTSPSRKAPMLFGVLFVAAAAGFGVGLAYSALPAVSTSTLTRLPLQSTSVTPLATAVTTESPDDSQPVGSSATPEEIAVAELGVLVESICGQAQDWVPGMHVAVAIRPSVGPTVGCNLDLLFISASAAKAYWVAAGLWYQAGPALESAAEAIFRNSDNAAAGSVIELVGG